MRQSSISAAHKIVSGLTWEPPRAAPRYATDYRLRRGAQRDPLRQVLMSYFPMQEEKDDRVYGAIDGALRGGMFDRVQPRWMEWQKFFLSMIPVAEGAAARAMAMLASVVPHAEIRNGLAIQMIDEVRHSAIQMNLKRVFLHNYVDPAGFDVSQRAFGQTYAGQVGRQFGEAFLAGDAVTASCIYLQIVAETAFTNTLFVAMPSVAAMNGDHLLPTVFLSVQSDESRHINNGYATLLMALADEENHALLERDLRYAWWNNHCVIDAAIGTFVEYGTMDRRRERESYAEMWRRWVYEDYYRGYLAPLERYGLTVPHDLVAEAAERIERSGYVHRIAQFFAAGWPLNFWRIDPLTDADFEWFEHKYPGWYAEYGAWWEEYREYSAPGDHPPIAFADTSYVAPLTCWTCMLPCVIRDRATMAEEDDGSVRTYCSQSCRWIDQEAFRATYAGRDTPAMGRLTGERDWLAAHHDADLAELVTAMGLVRPGGDALIAQPHLVVDDAHLWTLDHLRGLRLQSPNIRLAALDRPARERAFAGYLEGRAVA